MQYFIRIVAFKPRRTIRRILNIFLIIGVSLIHINGSLESSDSLKKPKRAIGAI